MILNDNGREKNKKSYEVKVAFHVFRDMNLISLFSNHVITYFPISLL